MIKGYRDLLKTPFPIYADPTKKTCELWIPVDHDSKSSAELIPSEMQTSRSE